MTDGFGSEKLCKHCPEHSVAGLRHQEQSGVVLVSKSLE